MVRHKNRYTVVEFVCNFKEANLRRHFNILMLKDMIMKTVIQVHGDHGAASITGGLQIKYSSARSSALILRTRHGPHRLLVSALPFVQQSPLGTVRFHSVYSSGTLRQCYKFLLKTHTKNLDFLWAKLSEPDREKLQESFSKEKT